MSDKKRLTIEGLEEYNIKWHERLQAMMINSTDAENIFIDAMMKNYTWSYEFDTGFGFEKTPYGYRHPWYYSSLDYPYLIGVVPFTLYGSENAFMTVDWGDGTVNTVASSIYQDPVVFRNSVHEYSNSGKYTISVTSSDWDQIYMVGGCASIGTYLLDVGYIGVYDSRVIDTKHEYPDDYGHPYLKQVGNQDSDIYYSAQNVMSLMRCGCTKIFNPLPKIAGTIVSELYEYDFDGNYSLQPVEIPPQQEFAGLPLYGQYLDDQLYFILDDTHNLGNNYPSNLFIYNKRSQIIGAFGEIDEVNGVKTPHITIVE